MTTIIEGILTINHQVGTITFQNTWTGAILLEVKNFPPPIIQVYDETTMKENSIIIDLESYDETNH